MHPSPALHVSQIALCLVLSNISGQSMYTSSHEVPPTAVQVIQYSWGVSLHQLSQTKEHGGHALPLAHT